MVDRIANRVTHLPAGAGTVVLRGTTGRHGTVRRPRIVRHRLLMAEVKVHRPTVSPHRLITAEVERRRLTVVVAVGTTAAAVADRPQDIVPLEVTPGTGKNCL
jgi:hypothetical protein